MDDLKAKWRETTPWVLVRHPGYKKGERRVRWMRLGAVDALELTIPGPRGGKGERRKELLVGGTGYRWSRCDVRRVTPELQAQIESLDAAVKRLQQRRDELLHGTFMELDPLTWEEIQDARKPWRRIYEAVEAYKKGEATSQYVHDVIREVLG